jgi:putative acetyltransferase
MLVIQHVTSPTDDVRSLIGELDAELNSAYEPQQRHGLNLDRIFQPGVMFFVAQLDGIPVGCGAVAFEDALAEIKRMYVRPAARGQGVSQAILARLEAEALRNGFDRLVLETGDAQHAAMRFYQRAGFTRCPPFGPYAKMPAGSIARSVFLEKSIGTKSRST